MTSYTQPPDLPPCPGETQGGILARVDLNSLLAAARQGDPVAIGDLVGRFQPQVAALVHRQLQTRLRPQQHALLRLLSTGDIVQEVFLEVLRGLDRWEGDHEQAFATMLATLVEHRIVDQIRRSQADRRDVRKLADSGPATAGVATGQQGPATLASSQEQLEIYRRVLGSFPERERALLGLRLEEGLEFAELAARLAYPSADAARKAYHAVEARLLLRLRQQGIQWDAR